MNNKRGQAYLRFRVGGVGPIKQAILRLYVTGNGTNDGPSVFATSNAWQESSIAWQNRPVPGARLVDHPGAMLAKTWVDLDVTSAIPDDGIYSFVLVANSNDGVTFSSREGDQPPQLILTSR